MAPKGRASRSNARDNRGSGRSTTKAGVTKRKVSARIDIDGDLDMDAGVKRPSRATNGTSNGPKSQTGPRSLPTKPKGPPRASSKATQAILKHLKDYTGDDISPRVLDSIAGRRKGRGGNLMFLRILGLRQSKVASNQDGGLSSLLSFLERKASSHSRPAVIKKSHAAGDYVFIGASKEDADELIKLNGCTFAGAQLEIVRSNEEQSVQSKATESAETQELRAKLQSILSQRYLSENKLLKLDALATDAELVTLGMFENRERALKTFKGLMVICDSLFKTAADKTNAIESISVAGNNIDDISQVESMATTFPQLKNLDLSGNQIGSMQAMARWKGKFRDLETLYMTGNPIEAADPVYQTTLLEWFPKLQNVNGTRMRTAEQIEQQLAASRPQPIPQSGPDFRDVNGIGENFLLDFFSSYDQDRQSLAARYYDETSQVSLAVDTRSVRDPDAPPPLPWSSYIRMSRNLMKITQINARTQRLFRGVGVIQDLWKGLPLTKHPNIKDEISKYIMDCHPLPGLADPLGQNKGGVDGLIVSVHGEFEEYDQKTGDRGKRSFSRTFLLGLGQPGRNPIRVVSDMLSLRAYSPLPNVFAAAAAAGEVAGPTPDNGRQTLIAELSKHTGMVAQYCEMCLSQVDWQFDKAIAIFNEKRAALPAEAFSAVLQ